MEKLIVGSPFEPVPSSDESSSYSFNVIMTAFGGNSGVIADDELDEDGLEDELWVDDELGIEYEQGSINFPPKNDSQV
ncbi:hypothetical protein AGMMS49938_17650 [Fibrobacterales bacterium]|nr:hypothetical protein AGMMS49938_17650 [Fibrobacterales bacterium]